jgi:hypothetical protein
MWKTIPVCLFVLLVSGVVLAQQPGGGPPATPDPCVAPQQKQFDFWLGEWDLTWPGAKPGEVGHGTNSITRVMDGCVVEENFSGGDSMHLRGKSLSVYVPRAGKWKQTWVDNEGGYLKFVGEFKDGMMILAREATRPDGTRILQRMVFKNITPRQFDWSWEFSKDGGNTWVVNWPIHYRRKS